MIYRFLDCTLDVERFELLAGGEPRKVEPQVFDVLRHLVENRDRVVTKDELREAVWKARFVSETTLSSRIKGARQAIGDTGREQKCIKTIHGRGFRFVADVVVEAGPTSEPPAVLPPVARSAVRDVLADSASTNRLTPPSELAERDEALAILARLLDQALTGRGRIAFIHGEAGIGKSSLVAAFRERATATEVWTGACDALSTPRPLGPLHDMARQVGPELAEGLREQGDRNAILGALLGRIEASPGGIVLVFEDVHWADEATIDVLVSLARRIERYRALVIVTYRSDEIGTAHPLLRLLGAAPGPITTRIPLEPLSPRAVRKLARDAAVSARGLHELTEGNPFFLTEVLANPRGTLPQTVRDAVLGRISRLSPDSRDVVELMSIAPGRFPFERLLRLRPGCEEAIDEALRVGTVRAEGDDLLFRHELARISVYDSLSPMRRRKLHRQLLDHLLGSEADSADPSEIVHHARAVTDVAAIRTFAPIAARRASAAGSHREAEEHFRAAVEQESAFERGTFAEILEGLSYEIYLTGDTKEAIAFRARALEHRRAEGQRLEEGSNLRWMSRLHWFLGRNEEARTYASQAVALLETLPPSRELAMAYSNRSQLAMLDSRAEGAFRWGHRAIDLATELDDQEVLAHALTNVGLAMVFDGSNAEGIEHLERALAICLARGFHEHAIRAYTGLGTSAVAVREFERSRESLEAGIRYCEENDLDSWRSYLDAYAARLALETGDIHGAMRRAAGVLERPGLPGISRIAALVPLGVARCRSGDPEGADPLREALELAQRTGELQRLAPAVVGLCECAWLDGSFDEVLGVLESTHALAVERNRVWEREQLRYWLWKAGRTVDADNLRTPFGLQLSGNWREAAAEWERIGSPWDRAMALGEGDAEGVRAAVSLMQDLGSSCGATAVLRDAKARGIDGNVRGSWILNSEF